MKNLSIILILFVFSFGLTYGAGGKISKDEMKFMETIEKKVYPYELDFKGTPLSDALSSISKATGISIVAAGDIVDLKIDLYLSKGQTVKRIIDTIKTANGLSYRILNGTMILSGDKDKEILKNGKVVGRVTEIDKISGIKGVTLSLSDNINTLVLSDVGGAFIIDDVIPGTYILKATHRGYKAFGQIVEVVADESINLTVIMVKQETRTSLIASTTNEVISDTGDRVKTKQIPLLYADPTEVKNVINDIVPLKSIVVYEKKNMIILKGIDENIKAAVNMIKDLDVPTHQVRIIAKIYDVRATVAEQVGIDWYAGTKDGDYDIDVKSQFKEGSFNLRFGQLVDSALEASLSMLNTTSDVKIIAEPNIVTLNGESAEIKVVQEEIVGTEKVTDDDGSSSEKPLFKEAGVILTVKPIIKSDQTILIELSTKVSKFIKGGTYQDAAEQKSESTTLIRVKNKETVRIGGLQREDVTDIVNKIPILGDLPLLGTFFSTTDKTTIKSNLYIEIYAEILEAGDITE